MANRLLKLIVVGQENVGKSCLVESLKLFLDGASKKDKFPKAFQYFESRVTPTDGISLKSCVVKLPKEPVTLHIWDFGGKEVFQSMQSFFLTEHAVFIVVWKITANVENSRVLSWLEAIRFYAPNSPVFIVGTHIDLIKRKRKETIQKTKEDVTDKFSSQFPKFKAVFAVSNVSGAGFKAVTRTLLSTISSHPFVNRPFPDVYKSCLMALEKTREGLLRNKQPPVLQWEAVENLISSCSVPRSEVTDVISYFSTGGSIVYLPGSEMRKKEKSTATAQNSRGFIVIDPEWIVQLFASVINFPSEGKRKGILSRKNLEDIWTSASVPPELHKQLLKILRLCEVTFQVSRHDTILVPSLLDNSLEHFRVLWPAHDPQTIQYTRYYDFEYVPTGIFSRLLVHIFNLKKKQYHYWKFGVIVEDYDDAQCLVEYIPQENRISVAARSKKAEKNPAVLFSTINELIEALNEHQFRAQVVQRIPCPQCLASQLPNPTLFDKSVIEDKKATDDPAFECHRDPQNEHIFLLHKVAPDIAMLDFECDRINPNSLVIGDPVGEGAFATVYKAKFKDSVVAVKVITIPKGTKSGKILQILNEFRREVRVMSRFQHSCLVELLGFSESRPPSMVLEFMPFSDLYTYLHNPANPVDWKFRLRVASDVAHAMSFLHTLDPPLVHRDLKSPNIMVASSNPVAPAVAKVADFGLSRELLTDSFRGQISKKRDVVNPTWLAPEIIRELPSDLPADVYPFGIILWELLTRAHPFPGYQFASEQEEAILSGTRPPIPQDCPAPYSALMITCWGEDPAQRPSFTEIYTRQLPNIIKFLVPELYPILSSIQFKENNRVRRSFLDSVKPHELVMRRGSLNVQPDRNVSSVSRSPPKSLSARDILELGFKPKTSVNIAKRWTSKPKDEPNAFIKQISGQLYTCPFPGDIEDWESFVSELAEYESYKVYNLSGHKYNYSIFKGIVVEYEMDIEATPLKLLQECVADIVMWISDSRKIALIHCAGKATRTTMVAASVLLKLKVYPSADIAISNVSDVTQCPNMAPSQKRYVNYFLHALTKGPSTKVLYLHKMRFSSIPNFKFTGGCEPIYSVEQEGKSIFFSKKMKGKKGDDSVEFFCKDIQVSGDVKIEFFHKTSASKMLGLFININYEEMPIDNILVYRLMELDKACKDVKHKHFSTKFQLELCLLSQDQIQKMTHQLRQQQKDKPSLPEIPSFRKKTLPERPNEGLSRYFAQHRKSTKYAPGHCYICENFINPGEMSINILPTVTVHYDCLECADCGVSLQDVVMESVVKNGRIICSRCMKDMFPNCQKCNRSIRHYEITNGSQNWHANCFSCAQCKKVIGNSPNYIFEDKKPFCLECRPSAQTITKEPKKQQGAHPGLNQSRGFDGGAERDEDEEGLIKRRRNAQEEELEQLLQDEKGRQSFKAFLPSSPSKNLLDFWADVEERKELPKLARVQAAKQIISNYFAPGSPKSLPRELLEKFPNIPLNTTARMLPNTTPSAAVENEDFFDDAQEMAFLELAHNHFECWTTSSTFMTYVEDLQVEIDSEDEEEQIRRNASEIVLPPKAVNRDLEEAKNRSVRGPSLLPLPTAPLVPKSQRLSMPALTKNPKKEAVNNDKEKEKEKEKEKTKEKDGPEPLNEMEMRKTDTDIPHTARKLEEGEIPDLPPKRPLPAASPRPVVQPPLKPQLNPPAEVWTEAHEAAARARKIANFIDEQRRLRGLAKGTSPTTSFTTTSSRNTSTPTAAIVKPAHSLSTSSVATILQDAFQAIENILQKCDHSLKIVEESVETGKKAFMLMRQPDRPMDIISKAVVRCIQEAAKAKKEAESCRAMLAPTRASIEEARRVAPDSDITSRIVHIARSISQTTTQAIQKAEEAQALANRAKELFAVRKEENQI